jgi:hypothetical protein
MSDFDNWKMLDEKCKEATGFHSGDISTRLMVKAIEDGFGQNPKLSLEDNIADIIGSNGDSTCRYLSEVIVGLVRERQ